MKEAGIQPSPHSPVPAQDRDLDIPAYAMNRTDRGGTFAIRDVDPGTDTDAVCWGLGNPAGGGGAQARRPA
jgi:hypothetical protein